MPVLKAKPWVPETFGPDIIFTNANVIDVQTGTVNANATLIISEGVILDSKPAQPSPSIVTIDLGGKYLLPGLIDCHVHMYGTQGSIAMSDIWSTQANSIAYRVTYSARNMLLRGFTTARDVGGADEALRAAIEEGLISGPRLFFAGKFLSQTGGHGDFRALHETTKSPQCCGGHDSHLGVLCDGVPACLSAAREELRKGAHFLKIMCGGGIASPADPLDMLQFTPEEIQAIVRTANNSGTYVTAHAYTSEAIRHAVDNGCLGIEHANFIDAETAKYCADKGVVVTPTLICYNTMITEDFEGFLTEGAKEKTRQVLASGLKSITTLQDAGVTMCFGSDMLGALHPYQNGEFSLLAKAIQPKEILQTATTNAAKLLRMEGKLGCLTPGAIADVLVLNKNPLEDVTVLDGMAGEIPAVDAIIKDGRVVFTKVDELKVDGLYQRMI